MTRRLIASLTATALLLAACSSQPASDTTANATAPATALSPATATQSPAAAPPQLQFTATTLDGQEFSGENLVGNPAVLWFWAPWCPTCQREAPVVGQSAADNPDVTFVGVAGLDEVAAMRQFVEEYPVKDFTQLADTDGQVWAKFGVTSQPAYAFVAADGNVDVVRSELSESELSERVAALTGQ